MTDDQAAVWPSRTLLGGLAPADRDALVALGVRRAFEPGAVLMREGDRSASVIVLLSGYVKVLGTAIDGHVVLLSVRAGGDLVGELSALDGMPRSATVVAATEVTAKIVPQREFLAYLDTRPAAMRALHHSVAAKLRMATRHRIDVGGTRLYVRLARILDHLADMYGEPADAGVLLGVPLTQTDVAALVGATEPSVHRALTRMRSEGLVSTGYRQLRIDNRAALRAIAAADPGQRRSR